MNYILGKDRLQARVECFEDYVDALTKVFESFVDFCIELGFYNKRITKWL